MNWVSDGKVLACASSANGTASTWNTTLDEQISNTANIGDVLVKWSPDGRRIAAVVEVDKEFVIKIMDSKSLELAQLPTRIYWNKRHLSSNRGGMAWSPDSRLLAIWQGWNRLEVWDLESNVLVHEFINEFHPIKPRRYESLPTIKSVSWSPPIRRFRSQRRSPLKQQHDLSWWVRSTITPRPVV